ncbi:TPA: hypothetical protein ACH3X3_012111 [Trebouxia sp. C0006]
MVTYLQLEQRRCSSKSPGKTAEAAITVPQQLECALEPGAVQAVTGQGTREGTDTSFRKAVSVSTSMEPHKWQATLKCTKASVGHTKPRSTHRHHPFRRSGKVKLSALLSQCPSLFDNKKISAVDKGLTDIDILPRHFHHVKTLYLSKNCLRSLQGMQQFSALVTLAAADNLIDSFDQLEFLTMAAQAHTLSTLRALSLEGNPIARLPNYRAHIVAHLPGLQMLDGRAIGPDEPQQAVQALRHQEVLMALMLTSACLVHKLSIAVQMQRVHAELKAQVLGPWGQHLSGPPPPPNTSDPTRLLQLWDYEASLSIQVISEVI